MLKLIVRAPMKKWCLTALWLPVALSGCIEVTTYVSPSAAGTVTDAVSHRPLQGATISVAEYPGLFAQTDADGQFVLTPVTRSTHIFALGPYESLPPKGTLVVAADGYVSREIAVRGSGNSLSVSLEKAH